MTRLLPTFATLGLLVATLGAAYGLAGTPAASAATPVPHAVNGTAVAKRLRVAIKALPTHAPTSAGYERDKFKHWVDADHDCQDTRSEVLRQEKRSAKVTGSCAVTSGRWVSPYDRTTFTTASGLDIDHLVPLAEAWKSDAKGWTAAKREAYANDLTDYRTLIAVSAHSNRSKGDRDPAQWMPTANKCRYLEQWVGAKLRWRLKVDAAEKSALLDKVTSNGCGNPVLRTHYAVVKTGGGGGGNDPRFDSCTEAEAHGYGPYYRGKDPEYAWYDDRDGDGVVCE